MRTAVLVRTESTDEGTFGLIAFGGERTYSLELPWRDNARGLSCIPPGAYRAVPTSHRRLGRVVAVLDVPGRSGILIHSANLAGDVKRRWDSQLQGCIAPCERIGRLRNRVGEWQRAGLVSRPALSRLLAWADDRPFTIDVETLT